MIFKAIVVFGICWAIASIIEKLRNWRDKTKPNNDGYLGRYRTTDVQPSSNSFQYRMPGGFPGDVNRMHPASIVARQMSRTTPVAQLGFPALIDGNNNQMRGFTTGDTQTTIDGVIVRSYPFQPTTGGITSDFGVAVPPPGVNDFLREGFIIVQLQNFTAAANPTLGAQVFIWVAASTGNHVQGGIEAAATASSTVAITNAQFNGPADSNGRIEIELWQGHSRF